MGKGNCKTKNQKLDNETENVGIIGKFDKAVAAEIFGGIAEDFDPDAKFVFNQTEDFCCSCLCSFILENNLSLIFLDTPS